MYTCCCEVARWGVQEIVLHALQMTYGNRAADPAVLHLPPAARFPGIHAAGGNCLPCGGARYLEHDPYRLRRDERPYPGESPGTSLYGCVYAARTVMCQPNKCKQDIRPWAWKSCFAFAAVSRQLQNNRITKRGVETVNRRSTPCLRDWIPPLQYIFRPISSEAGRFFVVVIRTSATADRSAYVPEAAGCRIVHADLRVDALPGAPHAGRVHAIPHHIRHHYP